MNLTRKRADELVNKIMNVSIDNIDYVSALEICKCIRNCQIKESEWWKNDNNY